MSLYTHWVCFDCRKSFHKVPNEEAWKCPDCTNLMIDMGVYFEPPRRQSIRRWNVMKLLAVSGYRFSTEGNKVYIEKFMLGAKNPSVENVKAIIEQEAKRIETIKLESRLSWHKEEKKRKRV